MKKIFLSILFVVALLPEGKAQSETPARYNKAIFVEALGNGLGASLNYDMRIKRGAQDGLGFRAGIGGLRVSGTNNSGQTAGATTFTLPLALNYLIGKRRNAFEAGLGVTPMYSKATVNELNSHGTIHMEGWDTSGFINIGYRFQPIKNGFVFRFAWTPAFNSSGFSPAWFGISAGIGFK